MDVENKASFDESRPKACFGARHTQMLALFIMIVIAYGMRVNLSVGIVAMTDTKSNSSFPTYHWEDKDIVLSSFFWGYVIPQIGAGHFSQQYGAKWFLAAAMLTCSSLSLLIPLMAELGSWGVMLCRALQGFCQGFLFPCVHTVLSRWIPLSERSRLGTFVYAGGPFGTVISMPLTGYICASSIGWPSVFYLYGVFGLVWALVWIVIGCDEPSKHKKIDPAEQKFIEAAIPKSNHDVPTPWRAILTSIPFWAILINHSGQNWGFFTLLTEIPSYMSSMLNFDMKDNGLISAAPYLALWILSFFFSALSDHMINKKILSVGTCRKIVNSIGHYTPAVALFALGYIKDNVPLAVTLLIIAVSSNSATFCGFQVNHMDLSPTHAGALMGLTNGISNIFSIIAPLAVQYIVTGGPNEAEQWKMVFTIAACIYVVCNTIYVIFASGELQPWDKEQVAVSEPKKIKRDKNPNLDSEDE